MESRNAKTVVAVILGGGAGTRLFPLTKRRAKPAVSASLHLNLLFISCKKVYQNVARSSWFSEDLNSWSGRERDRSPKERGKGRLTVD